MSRAIILLPLIFVISFFCSGQAPAVYNINKYTGLSTNHVYGTLVDKHGYLWLCTPDGVYRYNGYSLKKYGYNEGISNTDVWNFYEDGRGRIWLLSIAEDIGYIHHGRYTTVTRDSNRSHVLYPSNITELGDSLLFENRQAHLDTFELCIVAEDTLYSIIRPTNRPIHSILGERIIEADDSIMNVFQTRGWINSFSPTRTMRFSNFMNLIKTPTQRTAFFGKYLCVATQGDDKVYTYNIDNDSTDTLHLENRLNHCFPGKTAFYVLTQSRFLTYDSLFRLSSAIDLTKVPSGGNQNTMYMYATSDSLWNLCISTDLSGLLIVYPGKSGFHKKNTVADGYRFSGYINDTIGAWWNNNKKQMVYVKKDGNIINTQHLPVENNNKVISLNDTQALLVTRLGLYWIYPGKRPDNLDARYDSSYLSKPMRYISKAMNQALWFSRDVIVVDSLNLFLLKNNNGLVRARLLPEKRQIHTTDLAYGNFKGLAYSAKHQLIICYYNYKILVHNLVNNSQVTISSKHLGLVGIKGIESVFCDDFGNIIIKDYSGLYSYNWHTRKLKRLFRNYGLEKSIVFVRDNLLYIAGNFGILKSEFIGANVVANTRVFRNVKNIYYNFVTDAQFSPSSALLKTDKGLYNINLSADGEGDLNTPVRVILSLDDTLYRLAAADTLVISQDVNTIATDIINPTGMGVLNIEYEINGGSYNNTGYQLIIPPLQPGSYNTVSIIASDDSWRSKPLKFTIYIQPKWWQTQTAKRIIFVLSLLAFIGFVYLVIVITRRIVNQNNERRNQRRELELKSIYSQINPHFIFNSLSTAQYFVKKNKNKEAFEHINQFSDLLRAYIKSSRAKYITIAEEIENLENYLQLQLTRFEEKFDYTIEVDELVDAGKVKIPSLLLQPLVENALNHGIFHSDKKGNLSVIFKIDEQDKNTLVCVVDDDGVGRQRSKELRGKIIRKADSYGTILIKELIDTFNKYEDINIGIEYVDKLPPQSGTTVIVKIKDYSYVE